MRLSDLIRRKKGQRRRRIRKHHRRSLFEPLEPRLLLTGDLPGDDLTTAQAVDVTSGSPQTVNDEIGNGLYGDRDVDLFEISLSADQVLKADVDAFELDDGSQLSYLDGYLRLFDSSGNELNYNDAGTSSDDYGYNTYYDPYLSYVASVSGTYYVAVSGEYNTYYDPTLVDSGMSGSTGAYQLTLVAEDANPDVPGDQFDAAQVVNLVSGTPQTLTEEIGDGLYGDKDVDIFEIALSDGQSLEADVDAFYLDDGSNLSSLDGYLRGFDGSGNELTYSYYDASSDDFDGA